MHPNSSRPLLRALAGLMLAALVATTLGPVIPAAAATGDIGFAGPSTAGAGPAPTGEKPESKLWWNDGRWWASMYHAASGTWRIHYLDRAANPEAWVDTGTAIDDRPNTRADALWDGSKLYVGSHVTAANNGVGQSGRPARLYRYSYNSSTKSYTLDAGFPAAINDVSSETMTIDKDGAGRLWATWTQAQSVYVNATTGSDDAWGTPFVLPVVGATGLDVDDISTLTTFRGRTGVMWSSQSDSVVYFSLRSDTAAVTSWSPSVGITVPGANQADDHLNIKSLQSDGSGRVFAVIKTSLDAQGPGTAPQIVVLGRDFTSGAWSRATFGTVDDCHTRPQLVLDSTNSLVHVYATAPDSGCPFPGSVGSIFEKTSPMSSLSFPSGRGTPVMRDAASPNLNNVTTTKQTVNSTTGIVLMASNDAAQRYWFADSLAGSPPPVSVPVAGFSASPTSGQVPLAVQFTDTSAGSPTSWSWDFGDGSAASTQQNPSHTYTAAGTYR